MILPNLLPKLLDIKNAYGYWTEYCHDLDYDANWPYLFVSISFNISSSLLYSSGRFRVDVFILAFVGSVSQSSVGPRSYNYYVTFILLCKQVFEHFFEGRGLVIYLSVDFYLTGVL